MKEVSTFFSYSLDQRAEVTKFLESFNSSTLEDSFRQRFEVILHSKGFSRIGKMELAECLECAAELKRAGVSCFFQWDVLMVESVFLATCSLFKQIDFSNFVGVRVQDPGALHFLKEDAFPKEVHFITDQGNHNTLGLKRWLDYWPKKITRLVISPEIPAKDIQLLEQELDCELEVLGAGNILLFYTPRHLVSPLYGEEEQEGFQERGQSLVWGTSEESPHKGFPIVENQHGTFMYNTKEVLIFDEIESLLQLIKTQRVKFRIDYLLEPLSKEGLKELFKLLQVICMNRSSAPAQSKELWKEFATAYRPLGMTKGFFRTNKTDVLFKKLKSSRLQGERDLLIGEVVDVKKKKHIGIRLSSCDSPLKVGEAIELTSPEGNTRQTTLCSMKNVEGVELTSASKDQIIFIPHIGGISVKTVVCRLKAD